MKKQAHVPWSKHQKNNHPGITAGAGFDLSQCDEKDLMRLGLPPALVRKLVPYLRQRQENTGDSQEDLRVSSEDDIDILNMIIMYNMNRQNGKEAGSAKQSHSTQNPPDRVFVTPPCRKQDAPLPRHTPEMMEKRVLTAPGDSA